MVFTWFGCVGLLADDRRLQTGQRGSFGGGDDGVRFGVVGNGNVKESSSVVKYFIIQLNRERERERYR